MSERKKESPLVTHARSELKRTGFFKKDSVYRGMLGPAVIRMVRAFSKEGHTGFNAEIALSLFMRVANWNPIDPLTGEDDEWDNPDLPSQTLRNKRCPSVFKDAKTGVCHTAGYLFRGRKGQATFKSWSSRKRVRFPYVPTDPKVLPEWTKRWMRLRPICWRHQK